MQTRTILGCIKVSEAKSFSNMTADEKKARIEGLWDTVRDAVRFQGGFSYIAHKNNEKDRKAFGLSTDITYELPESQEVEEEIRDLEKPVFDDMAWYLINPESNFSIW